MAIAFRAGTGTTVDDANTATTSQTVTIPAGVAAADVVLLAVTGWDTSGATEVIQASSTGTTPVIIGSTQSRTFSSANLQGAVFYVVAGASDAGKVITVSCASGHTAKWNIALGAWSGVSNSAPVDSSAAVTNSGTGVSLTCATVTTHFTGDWCAELGTVALGGSAYGGGTGFTQRASHVDASSGGGAFIWDSNGTVTSPAGGAVFTNPGNNSWWIGFTVALAPPATTANGTATIIGAGTVTPLAVQSAPAALGGTGTVGSLATYGGGTYGSGNYGGGTSDIDAVQGTSATLTGTGTLTAATGATRGTATLTAAGTLSALAVQRAPSAIAGAGTLTAVPGSATQGTASLTGAGSLTSPAGQSAPVTLAGAGGLTAIAGASVQGSAVIAGAGTVTPLAVQAVPVLMTGAGTTAATAVLQPAAALAGTGVLAASAINLGPFNVARSTPSLAPGGTSAATVTDPRDGTATVS